MEVDDERLFGGPSLAVSPSEPSPHPPLPSSASENHPSRSAGRSASVAVYSSPPPGVLAPSSRKRASQGMPQAAPAIPTTRDVYSLPAAVAYAAAHPRRQIPKFGPYLLLQTLGEGEFGKVKLGLHMEYGEEVAVKLIRRGSVDNAVRFSKIEREIEVLRHLRHPNIVRLYDVIETDKYIGIIIEYASGGELFDHILAHRYLREKDAAKLFAQLVSGVSYLHAKKIVHRDLKLENLLLDRNRNVIITDFGFANKFEHKADDLMQTSCGSPCYAAPELVISEGLYVGSAVDIWSCGVILYAMLAGYLPFDDDPANPDGDNINLLYKYIINTQLTFPEYVSAEARDLLGIMLVPDPARRCDLDMIKQHSWLKGYTSLFEKSVDELEHQAMELQNAKRLQYQRMMRTREKEQQQQANKMNRTQSARLDTTSANAPGAPVPSSASTRTGKGPHQHEFLYETGGGQEQLHPNRGGRVVASAIIPTSHAAQYEDDPFGAEAPEDPTRERKSSTRSKSSKSPTKPNPAPSPSAPRKKAGYRHTVQLEYDDSEAAPPPPTPQINGSFPPTSPGPVQSSPSAMSPTELPQETPNHEPLTNGNVDTPRKVSSREQSNVTPKGRKTPSIITNTSANGIASPTTPRGSTRGTPVSPSLTRAPATEPAIPTQSTIEPPNQVVTIPSPSTSSNAEDKIPVAASSTVSVTHSVSSASNKSGTRHRKGLSLDKFNLNKLLGNGNGEAPEKPDRSKPPVSGPKKSPLAEVTPSSASSTVKSETASTKSKSSRRKTLTLMVSEPFKAGLKNKAHRSMTQPPAEASGSSLEKPQTSHQKAATADVNGTFTTEKQVPILPPMLTTDEMGSTNKAKKVMAWFRNRSLAKNAGDSVFSPVLPPSDSQPVVAPAFQPTSQADVEASTPTIETYRGKLNGNSTSSLSTPQVVITAADGQQPTTWGPSPRSASGASHTSTDTSASGPSKPKVNTSTSQPTSILKKTPEPSPTRSFNKSQLRVHHGAVDQATVTSGFPPEVFDHVTQVLISMGMEIQRESDFKYRCIRHKRKKGNLSGKESATSGLSAVSISGSAASNGVDKRGLPLPSSNSSFGSTGGMLRGLLMRRGSHSPAPFMQPQADLDDDRAGSPVNPADSAAREPMYGDRSVDQQDEVRFSVELTRIDRLEDTYSLDIRRLKGNLRSYKFLYDVLRERATPAQ